MDDKLPQYLMRGTCGLNALTSASRATLSWIGYHSKYDASLVWPCLLTISTNLIMAAFGYKTAIWVQYWIILSIVGAPTLTCCSNVR
jgi:hypothetical protein